MFGASAHIIDNLAIEYLCEYKIILIIAVIYALAGFCRLSELMDNDRTGILVKNIVSPIVYGFLMIASISYLVIGAYNPFIYFNF